MGTEEVEIKGRGRARWMAASRDKEATQRDPEALGAIEMTGEWPAALTCAGITLIPKGDGGAPLD